MIGTSTYSSAVTRGLYMRVDTWDMAVEVNRRGLVERPP
jgi:hypothetical protein